MILGKGKAKNEKEIIIEYHQFLLRQDYCQKILKILKEAPEAMGNRIGKPLSDWEDDDILDLFSDREKQTHFRYCAFIAFLFFHGYRRASLYILTRLPTHLTRLHREALKQVRQLLEKTSVELQYSNKTKVGSELNRLIWLLAVVGKPLEEITREDFERFSTDYHQWFSQAERCRSIKTDGRISRIERFLVHWKIIPPVKRVFKHEEYFNSLKHENIRNGILAYMNWYEAKSAPSSVNSRRVQVINFFLWLQENYPECGRLDDANREVAIDYARYLQGKVMSDEYSPKYRNDMYRGIRIMYDFVVFEQVKTSPHRNPFGLRDMPKDPDSLPRYIPDYQLRKVLDFCNNGATLKEKTVVTVLLHTGIRAFELAGLRTTDIVQIQGAWKLHIHEGKGLKDRLIPLNSTCLTVLQEWQEYGWEGINDHLFTWHGIPWSGGANVCTVVKALREKIGLSGITPHRFRHTFAVAMLNHGLRESALQKLMGHSTLNMTLEYGRILDKTVELSFNQAIDKMQESPVQLVPNFFKPEEYEPFEEADAINWIRLPHGYCRRHPKMHCESDVKCLLCERYCAHSENLECLQGMHQRYLELDMSVQADVVNSHIHILENQPESKVLNISQNRISV